MKSNKYLLLRVTFFVILIVCVDLWTNHHLGVGIANPGWLSGIIAVMASIFALLEKLLEKSEKESLVQRIYTIASSILSIPVLVIMYLFTIVVGLTYSSVMIIHEPGEEPLNVTLSSVDDPLYKKEQSFDGQDFIRFGVLTTPFGRPFRLRVDGYLPESLDVYPVVGLKIRSERDLRKSPSVLFRPPIGALRSLEDGGKIIVWKNTEKDENIIAQDDHYRGSFLLGRAQPIPTSYFNNWRLELEGLQVGKPVMSKTLLDWNRPKVLTALDLKPGMTLLAEVRTKTNITKAHITVTLGADKLIDVPMMGD